MESINSSYLDSSLGGIHISEYNYYCRDLLRQALRHRKSDHHPVNVNFGPSKVNFDNSLRTINIDTQIEHTLVIPGTTSLGKQPKVMIGNIPIEESQEKYLIRLDQYDYYKNLDGIIEYSAPNICNIQSIDDEDLKLYASKCKLVAPLLYQENFNDNNREGIFTIGSLSPRRQDFLQSTGIENISNIFSKQDLINFYSKKRILVNIHQTNHHRTFEELRVLPALSQGLIVISEDVPLKEEIPYHESIIWANFNDMKEVISDTSKNYNNLRKKIFTEELNDLFKKLRVNNINNINDLIFF